jgi:hypothetical protein
MAKALRSRLRRHHKSPNFQNGLDARSQHHPGRTVLIRVTNEDRVPRGKGVHHRTIPGSLHGSQGNGSGPSRRRKVRHTAAVHPTAPPSNFFYANFKHDRDIVRVEDAAWPYVHRLNEITEVFWPSNPAVPLFTIPGNKITVLRRKEGTPLQRTQLSSSTSLH